MSFILYFRFHLSFFNKRWWMHSFSVSRQHTEHNSLKVSQISGVFFKALQSCWAMYNFLRHVSWERPLPLQPDKINCLRWGTGRWDILSASHWDTVYDSLQSNTNFFALDSRVCEYSFYWCFFSQIPGYFSPQVTHILTDWLSGVMTLFVFVP